MLRQVVLSEDEYDEIEKKLMNYTETRKRLIELENVKKEFEDFKNQVSKMFVDDDGKFSYYETGQAYSNHLFLNEEVVAELFNQFFKESFFKESGLKVDKYWKFK